MMAMMTERLLQQVGQMQDVYRLEQLKKNKATQDKANKRYMDALTMTHRLMRTLFDLNASLSFSLKRETKDALIRMLVQMREVPIDGLPTQERLDDVSNAYKQVEKAIRQEWKIFHASITANPLRILQIAQALDPARCRETIEALRAGADWTLYGYQFFYDALRQSEEMIQRMNASEAVIDFLERMNRGAATIADLNPEVLDWLRNQSLVEHIYLNFNRG